uniref:Endoplasmic reticulum transmembrane protein n=1 Tax=Embidopsocus sp. OG9834 TaxID=2530332 RepID=A0A481SXG3_9NEOP|nr:bcr-associated protein [Embidopsocus sp. OG9834]
MSIQWTIIAGFLYAEIAVVLLLVLPVASPRRWQSVFRSRFLASLSRQASLYFYVLLFVLVLFLVDAIREMRKYSNADPQDSHGHSQIHIEMQVNMRLFRAQRNFYISGFALFLSLVIKRLVTLISSLSTMQAQSEAALKQAASASSRARDLLSQGGVVEQNTSNEAHDEEVNKLKSRLSKVEKELESERIDKDALKRQAESLSTEYDRLTEEYSKLQKKVATGSGGDKKDD